MKKLAICVLVALSVASTTAVAQTGNSSVSPEGWQSLSLQWNPSSFAPEQGESQSFTGLSVQYSKTFSVSRTTPFYIEVGVGLQYSFYSEDIGDNWYYGDDSEEKLKMFSLKAPVNIVYKWDIPNSSVSLLPYVGLICRYNISGNITRDSSKYEDEKYNVFKKSDMENTWNRLQLGWQIGANIRFNNTFYAGLSYGEDFSEIVKKTKINTTTITLGYCF